MEEAQHAEYDADALFQLIMPVSCPIDNLPKGTPNLSGRLTIRVKPDTIAHGILGKDVIREEFFCSYGLNPQFQSEIEEGGLVISGLDDNGEARIVELPGQTFYVASLFLPQLSSTPESPHPLIMAYLKSVLES